MGAQEEHYMSSRLRCDSKHSTHLSRMGGYLILLKATDVTLVVTLVRVVKSLHCMITSSTFLLIITYSFLCDFQVNMVAL